MRKLLFQTIVLFLLNSCSSADWYRDINLGNDFYYAVEPTFNSVNISTSKDDPMASSLSIIQDIESIGFNKECIIVISNTNDTLSYWLIDKTKETRIITNQDKEGKLKASVSNLVGPIDSLTFNNLLKQTGIELLSKTYYRQKLNYEKKAST